MFVIVGSQVNKDGTFDKWVSSGTESNGIFDTVEAAKNLIDGAVRYERSIGSTVHYWNSWTNNHTKATITMSIFALSGNAIVCD